MSDDLTRVASETDEELERAKGRLVAATQLRLVAIFYAIQALMSAGYISYILSFSLLLREFLPHSGFLPPGSEIDSQIVFLSLLFLAPSFLIEAFLEVPAGRISDRHGHPVAVRRSLIAYAIHAFLYLVVVGLLLAGSASMWQIQYTVFFLVFLLSAEVALRWGIALETGALNSWFVEEMEVNGYHGTLHTFMARKRLVTNTTWLIVGGVVLLLLSMETTHRWILCIPFAAAFVGYGGALLISRRYMSVTSRPTANVFHGSFRVGLVQILENPRLRMVLTTHTIFWTLGLFTLYFFQEPYRYLQGGSSDDKFRTVGALLWASVVVARVGTSEAIARYRGAIFPDFRGRYFVLSQVLMGVPMAALFLYFPHPHSSGEDMKLALLICAFVVSRIGQEIAKPITLSWIHEEISRTGNEAMRANRATIESIVEGSGVLGMVVLPVVVLLAESIGVRLSVVISVFSLLGFGVLIINIPLIHRFLKHSS